MQGIYSITNSINGKRYIGQSNDILKRWRNHISKLNNGKHKNSHLQRAWLKYGKDNFVFEILEEYNNDVIDDREIYYIKHFNSMANNMGYNITSGGKYCTVTEEHKIKLRKIYKDIGKAHLSDKDVKSIKMALYCLMDRHEIAKMFNVSVDVIKQIACGNSYYYVLEEYNNKIKNLKANLIDERNKEILKLFDKGCKIVEISKMLELSVSIVEKCVYKYRNSSKNNKEKQQKIYDEVMRLYKSGMNAYVISKKLGIGSTTANRYVRQINNPHNELSFKKVKSEDESIIFELYKHGESVKNIAKMFDVSDTTIRSAINRCKYANIEQIK